MNMTPETSTKDWGHIRSFVHHRSHMNAAQKHAYENLLHVWGLPYQEKLLDFATVFGNDKPVVFEIGCGMGETTAAIAAAAPHINFIGVEVYPAGVAALLKRIGEQNLTNLRVVQHDAVEVLRDMIPKVSLAGVHVFCPDPWPKSRHHKRRLIQSPFVANLATHIKTGGYIHCATDWQPYAEQMLAALQGEPSLENTVTEAAKNVASEHAHENGYASPKNPLITRPTTKFEARGQRLGHGMWDVIFGKAA